ncbi:MAG: pyridoxamine 5'-phosphate oxidase family protein [Planctomycetota bacterium]|jgi:predicted pyridoxine 5'-phosphate oxidase superfamily flavin-nucleotide-binding protein
MHKSDLAFSPAVKSVQERLGSRSTYARVADHVGWHPRITPEFAAFIEQRDSFYLGTAAENGQPYIQHRGGPRGFLKVLDDTRLAFADYAGNRQYISMGNLAENDRAFLFLMDYPTRRRIKVWGRAEVIEDDEELLARVRDPDYGAEPQRVFVFHVETWDRNCPQHIPQRYTVEEFKGLNS